MYKLMGYDNILDNLSLLKFDSKIIVNTINPHSYIVAKKDKKFRKALLSSDFLIPDGSGIMLAAKWIRGKSISKIAGNDLHKHLLEILNSTSGSVFYMGSSEVALQNIQKRLAREFPNIDVSTYSPPYKSELSNEDSKLIIEQINEFSPDVLFVGMTAPKQERWLYKNKDKLNFKVASSVGAVFDFYAGTIVRPSQFWLDLHLEWLLRLLKEPRRLWKRNFISAPLFLFDILLYKIGWKK
jgi:N-acetylglucosaminyldiphosphoundecaprenol N-acetyl-beta-D-mannosaminyltransferase